VNLFALKEVAEDECNCPMCGRPLWESITEPGESRYCADCNEVYGVKKGG
jgi:uncharacterized protein YbaR (Trm112 family)